MYHNFFVGQSILSSVGVCTIIDHLEGNTWGYECQRRDGRIFWLSADEMTPLMLNVGDAICARDNAGADHIGIVTRIEGTLMAFFAIGEHTVSIERIQWVAAAATAIVA